MLKKAGTNVGTIWWAVGAKAFNAPEVTGPALERMVERVAEAKDKAEKAVSSFEQLRESCVFIEQGRQDAGEGYDELRADELKQLVSYYYRATKSVGAGKCSQNKAASVMFLESLCDGELEELLANPPNGPVPPQVQATLLADGGETPTAAPPQLTHASSALNFGDPGCELPDGLVPVRAPDWLEAACTADSSSASQLVGMLIIYKWPARVGGWLVGEVRSVNTDKSNMVGEMCANFIVHYECDQQDAQHLLRATAYAKSEKSPVDAWVLLGKSD